MSDVHEQTRVLAELIRTDKSHDPFAAAVRATRMPMVITDPHQADNPVVFVNDAFVRLTGYGRDEALGRNCRFLQGAGTDRNDVARISDAIARRVPIEIVLRNYKKDGEAFWNNLLVAPVFDDDGALTYFFASQYDVTFDREHARALHESLAESERSLIGANADLTANEAQLSFQLTLDARLHDLSDPLAIMEEAIAALGQHLRVAQVGLGEIDEAQTHMTVHRDWNDGRLASVVGTWRMEDFGPAFVAEMKTGRTIAVGDVQKDERTRGPAVVAAYAANGIRSILVAPLVREGRMVATLFLHHDEPRCWSRAEIELVESTCARLWETVERARAEAQLRVSHAKLAQNERRLDALIRSSSDARFQVNADWTCLHHLAGGDFLIETASDREDWLDLYIPGDDRQAVGAEITRAVSTRTPFLIEHRVYRADATIGWALSRAVPLLDERGTIVEWYGAASDITDRKKAEAALQERETRLRLAIEAGQIGEWELDLSTNTSVRARRHDQVFGHSEPIASWGIEVFLEHVLPEDRAAVSAAFDQATETGTGWNFQCRIRRSDDGEVRWIMARSSVRRDDAERPVKLFGIVQDITEQKAAEIALRDLNATLEHRVAETLAQRARVEDQLRQAQKLDAIGQLTGGVAHDFNNLLTVIRSSVDLLKRPNLREDRRERYIEAISTTVDRAAKLTGQLLAFARRQALQPEVFAACDGVRSLAEMMDTLTGSRITVAIELPERRCHVRADPSQFDTALVNMAVNARDAMDGTGQLTISVRSVDELPAMRGHPAIARPYVAVALRDTGSGIAPDRLQHIFEPFFTTKETGKGTGLGLSQVFGFAKQSGGEVTVDSAVGVGSTFTLYLPQVAAEERSTDCDDDDEPAPLVEGMRVLLVEDNADVGAIAQQGLSDLGYAITHAADAEQALAELARDASRFDVVFSDVVMPGMDGIELAQEVRRLYHDLPMLLTSGYSHVLAQNGTYGFELLHKPYSVEQLSRMLHKATKWQRRRRRAET